MTQWVKILVTKHDKLSLTLGTLEVEGENWLYKLSSDLFVYTYVCPCNFF